MELIKDIVLRKHQEFFLGLKNNRFSPMPFFEAISVANAELCVLSKREKSLREYLVYSYIWDSLRSAISKTQGDIPKAQFLSEAKSRYSSLTLPIIQEMNSLISKDENLLSSIYKKFKIDPYETRKILVYPDIRQKWSLGVLKGQSYGNR